MRSILPAIALALSICLVLSCTKNPTAKTTSSCSGVLYGYFGHPDSNYSSCAVARINSSAATYTGMATIKTWNFTAKGAFCTADSAYYTYKVDTFAADTLYRIASDGTVTCLTNSAPTPVNPRTFLSILYNRFNGKFYSLVDSPGHMLAEVSISGSTFSITYLSTPGMVPDPFVNLTVDNTSGKIYFTSANDICVFDPTSSTVAIASSPGSILGLSFHNSSNALYALTSVTSTSYNLIKINPASGTISTVGTIPLFVNIKHYSTTIDQCSDLLIVSGSDNSSVSSGHLYEINLTSAAIVNHHVTPGVFYGLDYRY